MPRGTVSEKISDLKVLTNTETIIAAALSRGRTAKTDLCASLTH
jgi:hypothetical protein